MKKIILALIAIVSLSIANAQDPSSVTLNVYGGYTFMDRVRLDAYYADVQPAFEWGGGLEYFVRRNEAIEIKYKRMATNFPLYRPNGQQENIGNDAGSIQFITFGGNHYFASSTTQKAIPYIGGALGVGILSGPENTFTKFGWDVQAGVKVKTGKALSFKLNAYIQSVTSAFGNDFWYYPGWGTVVVADYATLFQFGLGGAVCFDFKRR